MNTVLLNLAYLTLVAVSLFPGGLRFRIGLIVQSVLFMSWGLASGTFTTVWWNAAFITVNVVQAVRIARRQSIQLADEEERVRQSLFPELSTHSFLQLWANGREDTLAAGSTLCVEGESQDDLFLLLEGSVQVTNRRGLDVVTHAGHFVGEMSFAAAEAASADVVALTEIRFQRWNHVDLRNLQRLDPDCALAIQTAIAQDVSAKLRA